MIHNREMEKQNFFLLISYLFNIKSKIQLYIIAYNESHR